MSFPQQFDSCISIVKTSIRERELMLLRQVSLATGLTQYSKCKYDEGRKSDTHKHAGT